MDGVNKAAVAIQAKNCVGFVVDGITIKNHLYGVYFDGNATDCILTNLYMENVTRGLYLSTATSYTTNNLTFTNFEINNCSEKAIYVPTVVGSTHNSTFSNFYIHDGSGIASGAIAISRLCDSVIKDGRTYKSTLDGQSTNGITVGETSQNVLIQNITTENEAWHGIESYGSLTGHVVNITIKDCITKFCKHGNIEIHMCTDGVNIINDTCIGGGSAWPGGVTNGISDKNVSNMYLSNVVVDNILRAFQFGSPGVLIDNSSCYNITEYPIHFSESNMTVRNSKIYTNNSSVVISALIDAQANGWLIDNCSIDEGNEIKAIVGNGTVRNMQNKLYKLEASNYAGISVEYTNGRVFTIPSSTKITQPVYTSSKSVAVYNATLTGEIFNVTAYNYSALPTAQNATVNPNNLTGSELANFTANSTNGNNVSFMVWNLTPGNNYAVKKDDVSVSTVAANNTGYISFYNSVWSSHTLTVEPYQVPPPVANFSATPLSGTASTIITFTDSSTNAEHWAWDFNSDGITDSTLPNPTHAYTTAGLYTVNLTVSNGAGTDSELKSAYILINANSGTDALKWFRWFIASFRRW
jgi:PKD repeat protein